MRRSCYLLILIICVISIAPSASSLRTTTCAFSRSSLSPLCLRRHAPSPLFPASTRTRRKYIAPSTLQSESTSILFSHRTSIATPHDNGTSSPPHSSATHTAKTPQQSTPNKSILDLPRHVAFICDGNSRWAEQKYLHKSMGHAAGADRVMTILTALQNQPSHQQQINQEVQNQQTTSSMKSTQNIQPTTTNNESIKNQRIEYCTLFAFSTENWSRPQSEISTIMQLMEKMAVQYREKAIKDGNIQIEVLGDLDDERIPEGTRRELRRLEKETQLACSKRMERRNENSEENDVLTVCLAINYGGRADILSAAHKLAQSIASGEVSPDDSSMQNELEISKRLRTSHLPDPDLIIRTGGERRLSNFLLWNAAYAELYFSDVLWPDFDDGALQDALRWYGTRKRRFGGRNEINS